MRAATSTERTVNDMPDLLKKVDMSLLHTIADMDSMPTGAFNIRKNGQGIARQ